MSRCITVLLATLALVACGSTKSSVDPIPTTGVIVSAELDHTWIAVQQACSKLSGGTQTLDAASYRARMNVGAVAVVIALQRHTSGGTIVRVGTNAEGASGASTTNRVLSEIQDAVR